MGRRCGRLSRVGARRIEAAIENWPHERFTLRQGIMLIREHPERQRK
jgi:hypothetical protein